MIKIVMESAFAPDHKGEPERAVSNQLISIGRKKYHLLKLSQNARRAIEEGHAIRQHLRPRYVPMLCRPLPWGEKSIGGYLRLKMQLVKKAGPCQKEAIDKSYLGHIHEAVNGAYTHGTWQGYLGKGLCLVRPDRHKRDERMGIARVRDCKAANNRTEKTILGGTGEPPQLIPPPTPQSIPARIEPPATKEPNVIQPAGKRIVLTRMDERKLEDFVVARWEEIIKGHMYMTEFAPVASKHIERPISEYHIKKAAEAVGKTWPTVRRQQGSNTDIARLASFVAIIAIKLGEEVPSDIKKLAGEYAP